MPDAQTSFKQDIPRSIESDLEKDEWRQTVEAALRKLPSAQRETLVLRIWGGFSLGQIGSMLAVSPYTVASRYRYGLRALRATLKEHAPR